MPFDVQGALQAGYSPAEIADHLGAETGFNVGGARRAGFSDDQIIGEISGRPRVSGYVEGMTKGLVPDGVPDAPAPSHQQATPAPRTVPETANFGKLQKLTMGLADPFYGIAQGLAHILPESSLQPYAGNGERVTAATIDRNVQQREADYQAKRKAAGEDGADWWRGAGNMAATAPLAFVPGANTALGAAAVGAASAATQPVTEGDYASEKAKQAAIGGAAGGITVPLVNGLSKVIYPAVADGTRRLLDAGVEMTPGQMLGRRAAILEDKLKSVPFLGDAIKEAQKRATDSVNRAAYGAALEPLGIKAPDAVGREGVDAVRKSIGAVYDEILPRMSFSVDHTLLADLQDISNRAATLEAPRQEQFAKILKQTFGDRVSKTLGVGDVTSPQHPGKTVFKSVGGETFKKIESDLMQKARTYAGSAVADERELGGLLRDTISALRDGLDRSNPDSAPILQAANQAWRGYSILRDAAAKTGAEEGAFTPAQLLQAVRNADKSVGKGRFATGDAYMQGLAEAAKTAMPTFPDSGTASRAALIGGIMGAGTALGRPEILIPMTLRPLYSQAGRRFAQAAITSRPDFLAPVGPAISRAAPGAAIAAPNLLQLLGQAD